MAKTLGPMVVETSDAESAKFTAPLVLVHGLWDEPRSWRPFTSFLSHRGWRCLSVGWTPATRESPASRAGALRQAIAELDEQPIVIGHDLGGLLALQVADLARAVVALAPLVPAGVSAGPMAALSGAGSWLQRLSGGDRVAGRRLSAVYPIAGAKEPSALLEALASEAGAPAGASDAPRLVISGDADPLIPPAAASALAEAHGADFEAVPGEHALHVEEGWEAHVGRVHRWLIKSQGQDLLAFYEEAWADREE